jgi:hypothetical protein
MRLADFIIQTLLIIAALITGATTWFAAEAVHLFSILQVALFCWQTVNSAISLAVDNSDAHIKWKHLVIIVIYVTSVLLTNHADVTALFENYGLQALAPAWALMLLYYYISWKLIRAQRKKGSFLPHLSF